ncbi:hypothetical protein ABZV67_45350 [Streptomyces sp. NPDC005065]|uniref:hypothetical protein n=1 Tax=Streptomyces sp. NPDC005065 TaxID=3154461 RepID=UPI0033BE6D2D
MIIEAPQAASHGASLQRAMRRIPDGTRKYTCSNSIRRAAVVLAATSALGLAVAPSASANWTSYISSWGNGDESRRWADESYSQLQFTGCYVTYGSQDVTVAYYRDIPFSTDAKYDSKTFTACFSGGTSNGEWTGLATGDYYFKATDVGGGGLLDVNKVYVDTTLAD